MGFFIMIFGVLLCGPSELLHFPDSIFMLLVGLAFTGMGAASTVIPIIPEMLDAVEGKY